MCMFYQYLLIKICGIKIGLNVQEEEACVDQRAGKSSMTQSSLKLNSSLQCTLMYLFLSFEKLNVEIAFKLLG